MTGSTAAPTGPECLTDDERQRLVWFALATLAELAGTPEWGADTLGEIAALAEQCDLTDGADPDGNAAFVMPARLRAAYGLATDAEGGAA